MRKVFLDNLPKKYGFGANKDKLVVDWNNCIGCEVEFIYDDVEGVLKILDYCKDTRHISFKYKDNDFSFLTGNFVKCKIYRIFDYDDRFIIYKGNTENFTGVKFGELSVEYLDKDRYIYNSKNNRKHRQYWICKCSCGKYTSVDIQELKSGKTKTCGLCCTIKEYLIREYGKEWMMKCWSSKNTIDPSKYSYKSEKYAYLKCIDCGTENKIRFNSFVANKSLGCVCGDGQSYPTKIMGSLLMQLSLDFETEYSPKWAIDEQGKQRRYDFYIPSKNLIIEMDGGWHYTDNKMNGITACESKKIDIWKDGVANINGIQVIRIRSDVSRLKYIMTNIKNSKLSTLFNLEDIDWGRCDELALTNLVKKACDLWNSGIHSTSEIGKNISTSSKTARLYLIKGSKLGICDYSKEKSDEARRVKLSRLNKERDGKRLIVCETGGIFNSIGELSDMSVELLGVKLNRSCICRVLNGDRKSHKGFTFKYIDKNS